MQQSLTLEECHKVGKLNQMLHVQLVRKTMVQGGMFQYEDAGDGVGCVDAEVDSGGVP